MRYFFKLINGEKLEVTYETFQNYINHVKDLYVLDYQKADLMICREQILFALRTK